MAKSVTTSRFATSAMGLMLTLGLGMGSWLSGPHAAAAASKTAVPGAFQSPAPPNVPWPPGPSRVLVETRCLFCHQAELIVAQRLTPAQWSKEVHKMVKWGAPLTPDEEKVLASYLAKHYAPARAPYKPRTINLPGHVR